MKTIRVKIQDPNSKKEKKPKKPKSFVKETLKEAKINGNNS